MDDPRPDPTAPQDRARAARRRVAGAGFVLLGGGYAVTSVQQRSGSGLWLLLAAVGAAVAVYGLLQLLPRRRSR